MTPYSGIAALAVAISRSFHGGVAQYDSCINGTVTDIGNGRCDAALNVPSCGFDGGDCCPCTCFDGPSYSCSDSDIDCIYPGCDDPPVTSEGTSCIYNFYVGDGRCDAGNNHIGCSWDGGDCCEVSCVSGPYYDSGENGYACLDPAFFDAEGMAKYPDYAGTWVSIGNGLCDASNNIASCGYDGGDCCLCSCSGLGCLSSDFDCLDPNTHDELYECKASLPAALPCSSEKVHQVGRSRRLGAGTGSGSGRKLFKRVIQGGVERPGRRGRNHRCRRRHRFYRRRCRHTCRH